MLKLLSRSFADSRVKATLRMLNLTPKPSEYIEVPPTSTPQEPKKKVKLVLSSNNKASSFSNEKLLQEFNNLPSTEHDLPLEFQERENQYNEIAKTLSEKSKARENFMRGMVTIPKEGKHYFIKERITENDGFHSMQIRSYILGMMRTQKGEGVSFEFSDIPEAIQKKHDMNTIKFYPGKVSASGEVDLNHWSLWYLKNQPEDIRSLQDSDWEPLEMSKERISDVEEMLLQDDWRKTGFIDKELTVNESIETTESLAADDGGADVSKEEAGNRVAGSDSIQCPLVEEFLDRKSNFIDDVKAKGVQVFLSKPGAKTTSFYSSLEAPDLLPPAPPITSLDLVGMSNDIESWCVFRNVPYFYQRLKDFEKIESRIHSNDPWVPVRLPSIMNYYETLPNYYKSHRLVQAVVSCLERFHPRTSRKHKELLINQLCNLITPRNPQKYLFLQEYINLPDSDEEEQVKEEEEEEQLEFEIDKETGMVTGLKQKKHDISESEGSEEDDGDLVKKIEKKEKKHAKKAKGKHDSDEESDEDDGKKKKKDKEKKAQGKGKKGKEDDEEDEGEDEDDDDEEPQKNDEFRQRIIKSFEKKEESSLSPDEQLQLLLGESIETTNQEDFTFDITDRTVDWFTMDLENPDGIVPSTLTFYDNKDGYWDHWIKEKRDRAGLPEISNRPYFKH